jgi:hypothetical protein
MFLPLLAAAMALPEPAQCQSIATDPNAALSYSTALQGYIYGYPIVDMLKQQHNETHRVRADQPVVAPVNTLAPYPHVLTPATQGQLRAANADTLYVNAWVDLSRGPVLLDVPDMAGRYYTLAFMDQYARPWHLGTRTNSGKAKRYALVGPSGGTVPEGTEIFRLPTDTAWMLGRILVDGTQDGPKAMAVARSMRMTGPAGSPVTDADAINPMASLDYFRLLNGALKTLPRLPHEAALMAQFDQAGFGPSVTFDPEKASASQKLGMGCALSIGATVLAKQGFKPDRFVNGWMSRSDVGDPGTNYLLRAELVRGGYVNAPEESIYPAGVIDNKGEPLTGTRQYRIRFAAGQEPPANAFWSLTPYDSKTNQLTENPIRRYQFGDRTKGAKRGKDGSLTIILSATQPKDGKANWLPTPTGAYHIVARLYLPRAEALDGRYSLPQIERITP